MVSELISTALKQTNAHGLARLVNEKQLYIRVIWFIVWLICGGLFLRQLVGFVNRLQAMDVTTNLQADALPFEFPDLYVCYDNPMSGSMHLQLSNSSVDYIKSTFLKANLIIGIWCEELDCDRNIEDMGSDTAAVQLNSLSYQFLAKEMAHTLEQSIYYATVFRHNGLTTKQVALVKTEFYHPSHLRCIKLSLNETLKQEIKFVGSGDSLLLSLMMDAADSRMGISDLPVVEALFYNLTAPFWALDSLSLYSKIRDPSLRIYITQPGHYPTSFDENVVLEAGRAYTLQLEMREQEHREDPSRCVEKHPDVQIVNPFDNSAYTVPYDYAYCYNEAVQAQFKRELNATCGFLPHPWPPSDHLVFNLSSEWGTIEDARKFYLGRRDMKPEEPLERCADRHPCRERTYSASVDSILWPSPEAVESELDKTIILDEDYFPNAPALRYLRSLKASGNTSQHLVDYIRANFLQVKVVIKKPRADLIVFSRSYSFESFVADVGGILGIYLGMSLLTACEMAQFFHDLLLFYLGKSRVDNKSQAEMTESAASVKITSKAESVRAIKKI